MPAQSRGGSFGGGAARMVVERMDDEQILARAGAAGGRG
jgi:hypothetical protein